MDPAKIAKNQEVPVRGPIGTVRVFLRDRLRRPSLHTDQTNCTRGSRIRDLLPIRRDGGEKDLSGERCKLQRFRPVAATAPQYVIRIGRVRDPLAVVGKGGSESRDAGKQRKELFRV